MECTLCCCCCNGLPPPGGTDCALALVTLQLFALAYWSFTAEFDWSIDAFGFAYVNYQWSREDGDIGDMLVSPRELLVNAYATWWTTLRHVHWDELMTQNWPIFSLLVHLHYMAPPGLWIKAYNILPWQANDPNVVCIDLDGTEVLATDPHRPGCTTLRGGKPLPGKRLRKGIINAPRAMLNVAERMRQEEGVWVLSPTVKKLIRDAQRATYEAYDRRNTTTAACAVQLFEVLDRMACHGWVPMQDTVSVVDLHTNKERKLHLRVFPFRDEMSDVVRGKQAFHCVDSFRLMSVRLAVQLGRPIKVVEVGAHFGDCAFWSCLGLGNNLDTFLAIELLPEAAQLAVETMARNTPLLRSLCDSNIMMSGVGLSDEEGDFDVAVPSGIMGGSEVGVPSVPELGVHRNVRLKVTTLDLELRARQLRGIDLVKIHAPSHELRILQGATGLIDRAEFGEAPILFLVQIYPDRAEEIRGLADFFLARDYVIAVSNTQVFSPGDAVRVCQATGASLLLAKRGGSLDIALGLPQG
eukprot:TRINITY_DN33917_c0_g1_i2.p1 TRINITY_DN33917_c0_g1~~TRINITY_DN33917_c0_g1_i2.p1  ORF type:complete len:525 (+),score=95.42 TRINITY_DN33917_c0_g1_i2:311-1885(+)